MESLKAARLKGMKPISGITLPLLNLDFTKKRHRSNIHSKFELKTKS